MGRTAIPCTFEDLVEAGIGTSQLATPRLEGEDIVIEAQYPKEFSINGAKFDVAYDPAQKLVTLRWQRGIRQPALSAVLLPRWNNWTVQLDLRGQVRTIRP